LLSHRPAVGGALIQSTAIWVAVSAQDGRPVPLDEPFQRVYGPSAGGRQVSARLTHPGLPGSAEGRPWPLRAADFDTAGHVNNAVHWAAVEDELAGLDWLPGRAELEYHRPIQPGAEPELVTSREPGELRAWLRQGPQRLASAWLTAAARP
jgi:acyl-ACP thioesterase